MKIITIYELLGLVKKGKAPKKVKIGNDILTLSKTKNIIQYNFERAGQLNWDYYIEHYRLDEKIVEILEEKKILEKLIPTSLKGIDNLDEKIEIAHIDTISVIETLNQVIDYLKSKGDNNE